MPNEVRMMMHKLLIVDDEFQIREGSAEYLRGEFANAFIDTAPSGEAALRKLQEESFDTMLLDIRMRGMDGLELLERLQALGKVPLTVLISGYQEFDYARRAIELKVVKYLVKPFSPDELAETVSQLFFLSEEKNEAEINCLPDGETEGVPGSSAMIRKYLDDHFREKLSLKTLSEEFGLNPDYIGKLFKKDTGTSVNAYINVKRIDEAHRLMRETTLNVSEIALACGYNDQTYFSTMFKKITGEAPSDYRNMT